MSRTTISLLLIPLLLASANAAPGNEHGQHKGHETEWSLTLVVDGLQGVDQEFLRVIAEHSQAGIPVSVEPGPNLTGPEAMAGLQGHIDPRIIRLPDSGQSIQQGQDATSDPECHALILAVMDEPPFLDPIVRPECLTEPEDCPSLPGNSIAIACRLW